jgi:hypothetical protein
MIVLIKLKKLYLLINIKVIEYDKMPKVFKVVFKIVKSKNLLHFIYFLKMKLIKFRSQFQFNSFDLKGNISKIKLSFILIHFRIKFILILFKISILKFLIVLHFELYNFYFEKQ